MLIVDAHLDLAYNALHRGRDVSQPAAEQPIVDREIATVGLPDLEQGEVDLICATVFCPPAAYGKRLGYTSAEEAYAIAVRQVEWYQEQVRVARMRLVQRPADVPTRSEPRGRPQAAVLLMEGADGIRTPGDVGWFFEQGLRVIGLTWRGTRAAGGTGRPGPLTDEGREVVRAMDKLGMIHDVSHLADEAFWQLMDATAGPVMASHSNCRSIVPTDRQLSDDMIKALAARGAVIGINLYDHFMVPPQDYKQRRANLKDVVEHVRHICDLTSSASHVGLGTDMDGGLGREEIPQEIASSRDLYKVAEALADAGFDDAAVRGVMGENWARFFQANLPL